MASCLTRVSVALFVLVALSAGPAGAQGVTAPGPYYATPSWDQSIPCAVGNCPRFVILSNMDNNAVLDRETGLVWERAPKSTALTFNSANRYCQHLIIGNRYGWRMPQTEELFSLLDPTQKSNFINAPAALPPGHPFGTVFGGAHWVKDRAAPPFNNNAQMLILFVDDPLINNTDDESLHAVWCVRGPGGSPTPW